jgi:pSer/pThr/pTyr-binding forkhead associated (FHA) protein
MGVLLEINAGPMAGKKIAIVTGQTVTFGRAAGRAEFPLPHDTFMSGVHFAVECGSGGCRVQDRKSSNGTFLNGAKIQDAMLANGDEIKGGQTIFAVKVVADAKLVALVMPQEDAPISAPQVPQPQAAEQAPPAVISSARAGEERINEPVEAAHGPAPSPRPPRVEPQAPPQAKGNANSARNAADQSSAPEAPAQGASPKPEAPAMRARPPVEELPASRAIPSVPRASATPPAAVPKSPSDSENPLGLGMNPPRVSAPPPGVASHIARKFGDGPLERGDGGLRGSAFSVMGWSFPAAPAEWHVQEGFGLQQSGHEDFPSSVAATEELLGGITLQQFVESQISMLRGYLRNPKIEPAMPPRVGGADESLAMDVRHTTKDGRELVYRRIYARSGTSVGVLTVTTLAADLPQVLLSLQPLLEGAAFRSTVPRN